MNRIKHYGIIEAESAKRLVDEVTDACQKGFLPVGGVSVYVVESGKGQEKSRKNMFCQALVMPVRPEDAIGQVIAKINGS